MSVAASSSRCASALLGGPFDRLREVATRFEGDLVLGVAVVVVSTVVTLTITAVFLVKIPADYFVAPHRGVEARMKTERASLAWRVGKNVLGVVLIFLGVFLSLPGIPGQGLLTIFVGIVLLDVRGKRTLELRLVRRRPLRRAIDRIRARFGAPPLVLDPSDPPPPPESGAP